MAALNKAPTLLKACCLKAYLGNPPGAHEFVADSGTFSLAVDQFLNSPAFIIALAALSNQFTAGSCIALVESIN